MTSNRVGQTALLVGTLLSSLFFACATFADGAADKISINDPYVRAVPPVVKTTAAFMAIQNGGEKERAIVKAESPFAGAVELHTHIHDAGVMRMRQVQQIPLPPKETVSLKPGGLHIMLFDIESQLKPGDEIAITLTFDDGTSKKITAVTRTIQPMMMKH